jgi:hypothetical protein
VGTGSKSAHTAGGELCEDLPEVLDDAMLSAVVGLVARVVLQQLDIKVTTAADGNGELLPGEKLEHIERHQRTNRAVSTQSTDIQRGRAGDRTSKIAGERHRKQAQTIRAGGTKGAYARPARMASSCGFASLRRVASTCRIYSRRFAQLTAGERLRFTAPCLNSLRNGLRLATRQYRHHLLVAQLRGEFHVGKHVLKVALVDSLITLQLLQRVRGVNVDELQVLLQKLFSRLKKGP